MGKYYDNAPMESFLATPRSEVVPRGCHLIRTEAISASQGLSDVTLKCLTDFPLNQGISQLAGAMSIADER